VLVRGGMPLTADSGLLGVATCEHGTATVTQSQMTIVASSSANHSVVHSCQSNAMANHSVIHSCQSSESESDVMANRSVIHSCQSNTMANHSVTHSCQLNESANHSAIHSCQSNESQSDVICSTFCQCDGLVLSSSRSLSTSVNQHVGLASVLGPHPRYLQPNDVRGRVPFCGGHREPKALRSQCQKVIASFPQILSQTFESSVDPPANSESIPVFSSTPAGDLKSYKLVRESFPCQGTSSLQGLATTTDQRNDSSPVPDPSLCHKTRPSGDAWTSNISTTSNLLRPSSSLQVEDQDASGMSSSRSRSPLCCGSVQPQTVTSSLAGATYDTLSSLYDELLPYLADIETEDLSSSDETTDDSY